MGRLASVLLYLGCVLLPLHVLGSVGSILKNDIVKPAFEFDLPVLEEPEEIEFPRSSDQSSRIPRAISYGWAKEECYAEEKKSACNKCKCDGGDDCMVLIESCTTTTCPLLEDKPVDAGSCCFTCPTYGDGSLEALTRECDRREAERAMEEGDLCPGTCSCAVEGSFTMCNILPTKMCERECRFKHGSDPCARCDCNHDGSACTLIMQVQSEPYCGKDVDPVAKEGVCGLTCPP